MRSAISASPAVAVATYRTGPSHAAASRSANVLLPERAPPSTSTRRKGTLLERDVASTHPQPLRRDDRLQVGHRPVESIALVDYDVVVLAHALHLTLGGRQADLPLLVGPCAARLQARQQLLERRGPQEDGDRVGQLPAHGTCALDIRCHDQVVAEPQAIADALQRDTVAIQVVHDGVLEE